MLPAGADNLIPPRIFLRSFRRTWHRPSLADSSGVELSAGQVLTRTLVLRRLLRREVLADDERRVAMLLPPSAAAVVVNAALAIDGRVGVNLNYTLSSEVLNRCIGKAGVRHVLSSRRVAERFPLKLDAEMVFLEDLKEKTTRADKLLAYAQARWMPIAWLERMLGLDRPGPDDVLTILFTSGSTGDPKGVMLTHRNIGSNVESFNQVLRIDHHDVLLGVLPFFHSYGYTTTLWSALTLEAKGVYHYTPLEPKAVGKLCRDHRATLLVAAPTFLRSYLRRSEPDDFRTLEVVVAGAEKLTSSLADSFERRFGVRPSEGFGATEVSPVVSCNLPRHRARPGEPVGHREGSVGRPIPGVQVKVVDRESGAELGPDQPGLLLVGGPGVMKGYLDDLEQTALAMRDGWYVTGDIARIDADGFLFITGRESRFSKLGGEMVPHLRIEEALREVLDLELEETIHLAVTAVPDARKGERLIVLHTGLPGQKSPGEVCHALASRGLPALWIPSPDSFCQVDAIPLLGAGKLDLKALRQLAEGHFPSRP